ncbi:serine/threonine phosphatase [Hassallia byssoidea VB512170]|uniref:Serine/threonine phosphatase n=1 Tax=Hassallia byssoidea VB512170 TaxID=1304833 RepID=A0A846H5M9_9CYAN|nr:serine/threonine phosphatase [Hassalia byssoidea]NEU72937.1 serine/threonine phosphatase [Hassalia byssoidea VB512170]
MLICPQCKFENSNTNKFCQNCGTSLTQKVCPKCSSAVAVNTERCHNCGAECGTIWWAIIAKEETFVEEVKESEPEDQKIKSLEDDSPLVCLSPQFAQASFPSGLIAFSELPVGSYLDSQQRYQLLDPLPALSEVAAHTELCVRVLDCQPYQVSPLLAILRNQQNNLIAPSTEAARIPNLAKPYIALQAGSHPEIPSIHDAWQENQRMVVLIENRSHWQYLAELWQDDNITSLQILHWFYQMTQLWALLEPLNCRQSLLELSNLRLDEDQTLALQKLNVERHTKNSAELSDAEAQPLTIEALGRVWQALFRQSQRTQSGSVIQLLGEIELGKIETIAQLRSRLEAIAAELQPATTATEPTVKEHTPSPTILQLDDTEDTAPRGDDMPTVVLPMQLISLEDAGRTDVGRQRQHNEDFFGVETKINKLELPKNRALQARGLYILCDGMGGHAGGEVASELAVTTLREYFQKHWLSNQLPSEDSIAEAVLLANQAIYDVNQQDARSGVGRMGTTLVMLLIQDTQAAVAHVGDSRLYKLTRKDKLKQITVDHEVGQREIARGVEPNLAYARPDAYQLTQALGPRDENLINPDVQFFEINQDTLFILASDGLSDNDLLEIHFSTHLEPLLSYGANLERGVRELIDLANQHNGHDNITAVLIRAKVRPNVESQKNS